MRRQSRERRKLPPTTPYTADVAVVFVHGIGAQKRGSTLAAGIECLETVGELETIKVSTPENPEEPWSTSLKLTTSTGAVRVLAVDGWWDDTVNLGSGSWRHVWRIWGWTVLIAPISLFWNGLLAMFATKGFDPATDSEDTWRTRLVHLHSLLWRGVIIIPLVLLGVMAGSLLAMIDPVLAKSPALGRFRIEKVAQPIIGDAWAFAASRQERTIISNRIKGVIGWSKRMTPRQVVVAHSQGGAISREVLSEIPVGALITIGSGAQQLEMARFHGARPFWLALGWLYVVYMPIMFAYLFVVLWVNLVALLQAFALMLIMFFMTIFTQQSLEWSQVLPTAFNLLLIPVRFFPVIIASTLLYAFIMLFNREGSTEGFGPVPTPHVEYWQEIISRYDLVCTGGGVDLWEAPVKPDVLEVVNYTTLFRIFKEHTLYLKNPAVARKILSTVGRVSSQTIEIGNNTVELAPRSHHAFDSFWVWGLPITIGLFVFIDWCPIRFFWELLFA